MSYLQNEKTIWKIVRNCYIYLYPENWYLKKLGLKRVEGKKEDIYSNSEREPVGTLFNVLEVEGWRFSLCPMTLGKHDFPCLVAFIFRHEFRDIGISSKVCLRCASRGA